MLRNNFIDATAIGIGTGTGIGIGFLVTHRHRYRHRLKFAIGASLVRTFIKEAHLRNNNRDFFFKKLIFLDLLAI